MISTQHKTTSKKGFEGAVCYTTALRIKEHIKTLSGELNLKQGRGSNLGNNKRLCKLIMADLSKRDSNQTEIDSFVVAEFDHLPKVESPADMDESEGKHYTDTGPKKRQKTTEDDMLYFTRGDVIKVTSKDASGWWWGQRYNMKQKLEEGQAGWLPASYVKDYFSTIQTSREDDPLQKSIEMLAQHPADWLSYCYTRSVKPAQAALIAAGETEKFFNGLQLLVKPRQETIKEGPDEEGKDIRVMRQFFDYERWNDEMNAKDPKRRKGRANSKLKKKKRINW